MDQTSHQEYVTLKEYFERRLDTLIKQIDDTKVEVKEKFLEVNFLRKQITDERGLYYTKDAIDGRLNELERRIRAAENKDAVLDGKQAVIGILTVVILTVLSNIILKAIWK